MNEEISQNEVDASLYSLHLLFHPIPSRPRSLILRPASPETSEQKCFALIAHHLKALGLKN